MIVITKIIKRIKFRQLRSAIWIYVIFFAFSNSLCAQNGKKRHISLRDSLDHAVDFSDFIIDANGFVPIPIIITEPALGGFGAAIAPIFLKKNKPFIDSAKGVVHVTPAPPDITGAMFLYTVNNTWLVGAGRSGVLTKNRLKYAVFGAYGNINMSFFRNIASLGEQEFKFNFKIAPFFLRAIKKVGRSRWYAGLNYNFLKTDVKPVGDSLPSFVKEIEVNSILSQPGITVEYESLDNVFTPDKGIKFHTDINRSDNIFGSDFDYWRFNYYVYAYKQLFPSLTCGLRLDGQQVAGGDPPFYLLPYIDMRGVEAARYQGKADILSELEFRWDFLKRWSLMFYGGAGKAFNEWSDFGSSKLVVSYGSGFRYLLARKFKLRMGVDIAKGPDTWAYYIVFGSSWRK